MNLKEPSSLFFSRLRKERRRPDYPGSFKILRAALGLGHLNPHDPQVEQLVDERSRDVGLLIHFPDVRTYFPIRELVHAVAEQGLILMEDRQPSRGLKSLHLSPLVVLWAP